MFIPPMLLETADAPFSHPEYIFEPKIDGHRLILSRIDAVTRLYTRHKTECKRQYPELHEIAEDDIILDGEVACVDHTGAIDFESVMQRFHTRKEEKIRMLATTEPVNFLVFDILRYKGEDLRSWPLIKRKELLHTLDLGNPHIATVPFIEREGEQLYEQIRSRQMEGMVAKRRESVYVGRRSDAWLKVINWTYAEVYITGYRKNEFGLLTSTAAADGSLRPTGIIEFGMSPDEKKELNKVKRRLAYKEDKNFVYMEPWVKARVKTRNWTKSGKLRDPVFVEYVV